MIDYLKQLDNETQKYFGILCPDFPTWLLPYIQTPQMQRLNKISQACGTDYTQLYNHHCFYNVLDHSVGCALIVWNFTKDKKQSLSALFHDIATPVFKHCIDFLYGDAETQESTEDLTQSIIEHSKEIMALLSDDNILLEEVCDYHIYPIADNDSPKLSSDRLEYTLQNGMKMNYGIKFSLFDIKQIYENLVVLVDENGIEELGFKDQEIAEEFILMASVIWPHWCDNRFKITAQFYADTIKKMIELKELNIADFYLYSETEVIEKMSNSKNRCISDCFKKFQAATSINESDTMPTNNQYCVSVNAKKRYINPLVATKPINQRIYNLSNPVKSKIDSFLDSKTPKYVYFDFNF